MLNQAEKDNFKQQLAAFFNGRTNYDKESDFHPRLANRLLEISQLHSGQKILDVATGTGLVAIPAAKIVAPEGKVIGVDISTGMLSQAQQKIDAEGLQNIELIEADADKLNFSNNTFDAILCSSAIVWFTDIPCVLRLWHRFLKKGGVVVFSTFSDTSFTTYALIKKIAQKYGIFISDVKEPLGSPGKCHKMLQETGFVDIEVKIEQFGAYLNRSDVEKAWKENWKTPGGNPVLQMEPQKLKQFEAEYMAEVEVLATDQGIWNDITTFFVLARK
ncbi:class I SAM-dependent methyltransferase [Cyanobacteria bacterium FACHB-472]|nr:class I SAM-dependent methyltransferase [Cyanobacteria bacterium FACHB-472]